MYQQNSPTCLGVPTPESLKQLVTAPPACLVTRGDLEANEIIRELGKDFGRPGDEITQATNLTNGLSDILVLLERPLHRQNHKFDVSLEDFVQGSKTLSAVNELIQFATQGARSIHTVTVLNAFPFQPNKLATEKAKNGHEALVRILKAKNPKVILRCHREEYWDEWLKRIELPGRDYQLERKEISITEDHTTVVLQSFHPSCAVNNADCRPEYRALLMYHFVAAFAELRYQFNLPDTAESIRKLCLIKGERRWQDQPKYTSWQAAFLISEALEKPYDGPRKAQFVDFADEQPAELRKRQVMHTNAMYKSLERLFGSFQTFGALGIAKVIMFLWKQHFRSDPLYQHVLSWLILRGNEQKDWFPRSIHHKVHRPSLEKRLSRLRLAAPNLLDLNQKAVCMTTQAVAAISETEIIGSELRTAMIDIFEQQNIFIRKNILKLSLSNINHAMSISRLLARFDIFLSAIKDTPDTLQPEELNDLLRCLRQLPHLLVAKDD